MLTLATKRSTPCERVWKSVPENGVFSCVPFCLRSLERSERCESQYLTDLSAFAKDVAVAPVLVTGRARFREHIRDVKGGLIEFKGRPTWLVIPPQFATQLTSLGVLVIGTLGALAGLHTVGFAD